MEAWIRIGGFHVDDSYLIKTIPEKEKHFLSNNLHEA